MKPNKYHVQIPVMLVLSIPVEAYTEERAKAKGEARFYQMGDQKLLEMALEHGCEIGDKIKEPTVHKVDM